MAFDFIGFKFAPSDYEIITYYLIPKIHNEQHIQGDMIKEEAVMKVEPQYLDWSPVTYLKNHERYYFVKREPISTKSGRASKRAKRTLECHTGFWQLSTGIHKIKDLEGNIVGLSGTLNFYTYLDPNIKDTKTAKKSTRWLMTEYKLPGDDFQEWVVCKVKDNESEKQVVSDIVYNQPAQPQVEICHIDKMAVVVNYDIEAAPQVQPPQEQENIINGALVPDNFFSGVSFHMDQYGQLVTKADQQEVEGHQNADHEILMSSNVLISDAKEVQLAPQPVVRRRDPDPFAPHVDKDYF